MCLVGIKDIGLKEDLHYLARLYPYDDVNKYPYHVTINDNLPYRFCGIQPNIFGELQVEVFSCYEDDNQSNATSMYFNNMRFEKIQKEISLKEQSAVDLKTIHRLRNNLIEGIKLVRRMLDGTDTIINVASSGFVKIADLINEVKEKYPDFYELAPSRWREQANSISINISDVTKLDNPEFPHIRLMIYLSTNKLELVKSANLSGLNDNSLRKIFGDSIRKISSPNKKDKILKYQISFDNIFYKREEIVITRTRLKEAMTYLRMTFD
ncbi:MAG: hypothetical protein LBL30_02565 [Holosporales bacterium]|jgi:hypothetical protein|nr:hypothetical protein [Holosporales bacterium]